MLEREGAGGYSVAAGDPSQRRLMIIGIGMDVVEVERVAELLERHPERACSKLFTPAEVGRCRRSRVPHESFAARFAAKEAFFKAIGTGWGRGGSWTDVEVVSSPIGAPSITLSGEARRRAEELGVARVHLTLTHTHRIAGACVVLEGRPEPR